MLTSIFVAALATFAMNPPARVSYYPLKLDDPKAVYVTPEAFGVHADGVSDDTDALQKAIDQLQETTREGIVFLPSGRYKITRALQVWGGIRVIGYGPTRPTLFLAPNTPGYGERERQMVFFAGGRPGKGHLDLDKPGVRGPSELTLDYNGDANPGTFYSAMSNVDIEIAEGNPGAVGIRARYAQHCYLAHMDFRLGSAFAGIHDVGNLAEDLHFHGGQHGLILRTPSPGWQFTLMDSSFDGQKGAAIRTYETGLTLIRPSFQNVPTAISVEPGRTEQLWMSDARMENVSGPALEISRGNSVRTQINLENVACSAVPTFATFRESGKALAGKGAQYVVKSLSHGLSYSDIGAEGEVKTSFAAQEVAQLPAPKRSDIFPLPLAETWVNVNTLGLKGDGEADDTAALKAAIANHRTLYFPSGHYRVTETIALKPDTVLVGLHPYTTRILIKDRTAAFSGVPETDSGGGRRAPSLPFPGEPTALLETPKGGTNVVSGLGLDTGGDNPGAVGTRWMAGADSMMEDVKFLGGHGSIEWNKIYNANHSADPDPKRRWDSQFPSLWVTDGGGGTFKNIWTASTFASAGAAITNTTTEGRIYEMSSEHHVRYEVQLRNASNWSLYALQTEEERGEGSACLPLEIDNSTNILVANLNNYRVISVFQPFPYAVKVSASKNIRFRNVHCYSNSKASFDSVLFDQTHQRELRQREFANLDLDGNKPSPGRVRLPKTVDPDSKLTKLAGGFYNISGGDVDADGNYTFIDSKNQRILRWNAATHSIETIQDSPLMPVNLWYDQAGNLIVVSYAGKGIVYSFKPGDDRLSVLKAEPAKDRPGTTPILPVTGWMIEDGLKEGKPFSRPFHFASPDGTTFLAAGKDFINGELSWGVKSMDVIRSFGLAKAVPGKPFYVMGESECETYVANVKPDGTLVNGKLFAEQGGEGLAVDPSGNVYVAAGQIYVYDPTGKRIGTIDVPERPTQLMFGGKDGKTLFIAARTSLYSIRIW